MALRIQSPFEWGWNRSKVTVSEIGAAKPDWIIATGYINDLILIRQQMADQNVMAKVITGINGPQYQEWIDAVGGVGNGVTTASWFHSSDSTDDWSWAFAKRSRTTLGATNVITVARASPPPIQAYRGTKPRSPCPRARPASITTNPLSALFRSIPLRSSDSAID